jgi:DNA-binding CsgD family transcriptional regulator
VGEEEEADLLCSPLPARPASTRRSGSGPRLSARELEILDYLVDGWSNAEIASALRIGLRTVRFHLEGLYSKLGATRRGEAVREGVRLGLVSFEA